MKIRAHVGILNQDNPYDRDLDGCPCHCHDVEPKNRGRDMGDCAEGNHDPAICHFPEEHEGRPCHCREDLDTVPSAANPYQHLSRSLSVARTETHISVPKSILLNARSHLMYCVCTGSAKEACADLAAFLEE